MLGDPCTPAVVSRLLPDPCCLPKLPFALLLKGTGLPFALLLKGTEVPFELPLVGTGLPAEVGVL